MQHVHVCMHASTQVRVLVFAADKQPETVGALRSFRCTQHKFRYFPYSQNVRVRARAFHVQHKSIKSMGRKHDYGVCCVSGHMIAVWLRLNGISPAAVQSTHLSL